MKRCGFFDVDATWYRWQLFASWIEYMVAEGLLPRIVLSQVEEKFRAYKTRRGEFGDWSWSLVRAYQDNKRMRGIRVEDVKFVAAKLIRERGNEVHVFTRELAGAAHDCGYESAVISGSPVEVIEEFARVNVVTHFMGSEHPHEDGFYIGGPPKEWFYEKGNCVRMLAEKHGIDLEQSFAIGDSESDIKMLEVVRYPIAFNPNEALYRVARDRRWPIIIEKKMVYVERYRSNEQFKTWGGDRDFIRTEGTLSDILPLELATALNHRLVKLNVLA